MKLSGHMASLENKFRIKNELLDLLVDGPSSFAALYGSLSRHYAYSGDVVSIFGLLQEMTFEHLTEIWLLSDSYSEPTEDQVKKALAAYEAWLPSASTEELAIDEIGIWFKITELGLKFWKTNDSQKY